MANPRGLSPARSRPECSSQRRVRVRLTAPSSAGGGAGLTSIDATPARAATLVNPGTGAPAGSQSTKLSPCIQAFLNKELPKHSLPTGQVPNITISSGWSGFAANTVHFFSPKTPAVTVGSNIYTGGNFSTYTNPNTLGFWHEIVHTGQYEIGELSATEYVVTGALVGGGHDDIMQEMLADRIGGDLLTAWRNGGGNAQCRRN